MPPLLAAKLASALLVGALLAGGLALSPLAAGASPTANPPSQWSSYQLGPVSAVFPAAFPEVQLYQQSNHSVFSGLEIDGVFELDPATVPRPLIVAEAFPTAASGFNVTVPNDLTQHPLILSAALEVRAADTPLWGLYGAVPAPAVAAPVGGTLMSIAFSATSGDSAGVVVNWSIGAWPWRHPGDSLAVELRFVTPSASALDACAAGAPSSALLPPCSGESIAPRAIVWDTSLTSVEGVSSTGPVASVAWGAGAAPASGMVGALASSNGTAEIILATPASVPPQGGVTFTLSEPAVAAPAALLRGSTAVFVLTLAVVGGAGAVAIQLYRRRGRRLTEAL